jgi:3D (Asp-Asp-Asp) domain-containing protein
MAQSKTNDNRVLKDNVKTEPLVVKTVSVAPSNAFAFVATAYSLQGKTASGERVRRGIIAADTRILPIGTVVQIYGMGTFVVKDTGGGIKGNRIDIYMPSVSDARKFGRRTIQLRIISKPKK